MPIPEEIKPPCESSGTELNTTPAEFSSASADQINAELLTCLKLLEPYFPSEAEVGEFARLSNGRTWLFDFVCQRARRAIAEASAVTECSTETRIS
jgi:hypothetical protein